MKQLFIFILLIFSLSSSAQEVPYTATYSSNFEIGDTKNAQAVLMLWKGWENADFSAETNYYADLVTMYLADGTVLHTSKDS